MLSKKIKAAVTSLAMALTMATTSFTGITANAASVKATTVASASSTKTYFSGTTNVKITRVGNYSVSVYANLGQGYKTYKGTYATRNDGQKINLYFMPELGENIYVNGVRTWRETIVDMWYTMSASEYASFMTHGNFTVTNVKYSGYKETFSSGKYREKSVAGFSGGKLSGNWQSRIYF